MPCPPERVIFLDRDGVINRKRKDHVRSWGQLEFLPRSLDALRALRDLDECVVVVTNQSVVGRGLITAAELVAIHERMLEVVTRHGGHIERIYVCPHARGHGCVCRKPAAGLLLRAARELCVDLEQSVLVGDSLTDVQAAQAAGCRPIVVGERPVVGVDLHVASVADLREAVALIASDRRRVPAGC